MAFVHGKKTVIKLNAVDISAFCNTSTFTRSADSHDVTTFGQDNHVYLGGLGDGTSSIGGIYDNGATGPRDVIEPLIGTVVTLVRQPEGAGSGLPQDSVQVLVQNFVETSPVADMVTWTAELQLSGAVDSTNQV
jgi:hypothetical protein